MDNSAIMPAEAQAALLEKVVVGGDLSKLTSTQRVQYYQAVCQSVGVNPLTKPFDYITLNGKLTLYATRTCTDQIRANTKISIAITGREIMDDVYVVTARGTLPDGRTDESTGAVPIAGLKGEQKANAFLKCETKAKRRLTLSMAGLGWMDESEVSTVPTAYPAHVDLETGEITPQILPPNATSSKPTTEPKGTNPLVDAGFPPEFRTTLARWIAPGRKGHQWSGEQKGAFAKMGEALVLAAKAGVPVEELMATVEAYPDLDGDPLQNVAACVAQIEGMRESWLAQDAPATTDGLALEGDGLPAELPF